MNTRGAVKAPHDPAILLHPHKNGSKQRAAILFVHKQKGGSGFPLPPFHRPASLPGERSVEDQLQPVVDPQLSHFRQVPLRTRVMLPHSPQGSPSYPRARASRMRSKRWSLVLPP